MHEGADALNPEDEDEDDADEDEAYHRGATDVDDETPPLMSRSAIVRTACKERDAVVVVVVVVGP